MIEHDHEPTPGLPGTLPPGERILWQGSPDWRALARNAFHTRLIGLYFILLAGWALVSAIGSGIHSVRDLTGVAMTGMLGVVAVALLHLLAWGSARTTIYTLTNRRIVMRIGMAVPKCINLPLNSIAALDLGTYADGTGDLPLDLTGAPKLGYLALWPHARGWKIARPQPALRAVPDAAIIAALIVRTWHAANPGSRQAQAAVAPEAAKPVFGEAVAA